jgi:DNA polymerase III sliding clamp (beta) subunit (PCNA family)
MKVTRSSLVTAIEDVLPIVKDTFVRSMSVVAFDEGVVRANNGSIGIASKLETGVRCCVAGRKFYSILGSLRAEEVELIHEGDNLKVVADGFEADIIADSLESYPIMVRPVEKLTSIPRDLYDGISLVRFSVSKDAMRPELCGISIKGDMIFAADGYRATKAKIVTKLDKYVLIHPTVVDLMLKRQDVTKYNITDNWIHLGLEDERVIISCSLLGYEYPDISGAFKDEVGLEEIPMPKGFKDVVKRSCITMEGIFLLDKMVNLISTGKVLKLKSKSTRFGSVTETLKLENPLMEFNVNVNPVFLQESVRLGAKVYYDPLNICLKFKMENFEHVVVVESEKENG